ncbi:ADGRB2 [Branchiostoma lanceolatum]|uniref:ADGRB2 protein n=1 Tax=Branchiostoma lanceolatum TaxID=7740 RepID=A0A8J9ZRB2_BRALA|nr:ADGRB2 [Branchiostoma lanceolatum]
MTPKTKTRLVIILLLLMVTGPSEGWRRRRRRRAPTPVNCAWGPWGSWGGCSAPCGNSGTRTRARGVARHAQHGGAGCAGPSSQTEPCNRFCHNGGTPFASHCACEGDYWNTCCQSACTPISHCASLSCSHGSNQECQRCDGDYGVRGQAFDNLGTRCRQACSWREDSNSCYPGTCASGVQSCTCAPGFGGPHCRTIQQAPAFHDCTYELTGNNRITTLQGNCSRSSEDGDSAYIHMARVERIRVKWTATFQPISLPDAPVYVKSMALGITEGSIVVSLQNENVTTASETTTCSTAIGTGTADNPVQGMFTCEEDISLDWTASPGQGIQILLKATAGGNLHLYDRDSNSAVKVKYFTGFHGNHTADIIFNFKPPEQSTPSPEGPTSIPWVLYGGLGAGVLIFLIITVAVCCCCCCYCRKGQRDPGQTPAPCPKDSYRNSAYSHDIYENVGGGSIASGDSYYLRPLPPPPTNTSEKDREYVDLKSHEYQGLKPHEYQGLKRH